MNCKKCGMEISKGDICETCFNEREEKFHMMEIHAKKDFLKDMISKLEDVLETLYYLQEQEATLPEKLGKQIADIFKGEK